MLDSYTVMLKLVFWQRKQIDRGGVIRGLWILPGRIIKINHLRKEYYVCLVVVNVSGIRSLLISGKNAFARIGIRRKTVNCVWYLAV